MSSALRDVGPAAVEPRLRNRLIIPIRRCACCRGARMDGRRHPIATTRAHIMISRFSVPPMSRTHNREADGRNSSLPPPTGQPSACQSTSVYRCGATDRGKEGPPRIVLGMFPVDGEVMDGRRAFIGTGTWRSRDPLRCPGAACNAYGSRLCERELACGLRQSRAASEGSPRRFSRGKSCGRIPSRRDGRGGRCTRST
jgi:hypothetical protein